MGICGSRAGVRTSKSATGIPFCSTSLERRSSPGGQLGNDLGNLLQHELPSIGVEMALKVLEPAVSLLADGAMKHHGHSSNCERGRTVSSLVHRERAWLMLL